MPACGLIAGDDASPVTENVSVEAHLFQLMFQSDEIFRACSEQRCRAVHNCWIESAGARASRPHETPKGAWLTLRYSGRWGLVHGRENGIACRKL